MANDKRSLFTQALLAIYGQLKIAWQISCTDLAQTCNTEKEAGPRAGFFLL